MADQGPEMAARAAVLLVWPPSRLVRELRAFLLPELQEQWVLAASAGARHAEARLPPLAARELASGGVLARLSFPAAAGQAQALPLLLAAARQCTLLTAVLQPLADGASLEQAAAEAAQQLPAGTAAHHPLRVLSVGSSAARAPAERSLRRRLQQLGLGSRPEAGRQALWCIHEQSPRQQRSEEAEGDRPPANDQPGLEQSASAADQQQPGESFLLALELAAGAPPSPAAAAAARQLGPTAMQPELAALSASLAGVRAGSVVLDPFCGTGSLLAAALQRGAGLVVGSDIDASHFPAQAGNLNGSQSSNGNTEVACNGGMAAGSSVGDSNGSAAASSGPSCAFMQADACSLRQLLPAGVADAILTDLPYGYRTTVAAAAGEAAAGEVAAAGGAAAGEAAGDSAGQAAGEAAVEAAEDRRKLLIALLDLAAHLLVPGGRLLAWLPQEGGLQQAEGSQLQPEQHQRQRQQVWLAEAGAERGLRLLHLLPESRQTGYPRAVALFELDSRAGLDNAPSSCSSSSRRDALLGALLAAEANGARLRFASRGWQQGEQQVVRQSDGCGAGKGSETAAVADAEGDAAAAAVRQRGLSYKQVRGTARGAAIDVWRAAWLGDVAAIREYAAAGGGVNARDRKRQTPLQFAAGYGREAAVDLLLQLGADPCAAADASGMAPLHRAAARNHAAVVRRLLAGGASPWQASAAGQTAVMYASQFGHEAALEALLEHLAAAEGGEAGSTDIADGSGTSACGGTSGKGRLQDRSLAAHLALQDGAGLTALHLAAQWGMAGAAERLLAAGADPNARSSCERRLTPAHLAARWGHPAVLELLARQGADLGAACGGRGWTPLQEAQEWRRAACVDFLLGHSAGNG